MFRVRMTFGFSLCFLVFFCSQCLCWRRWLGFLVSATRCISLSSSKHSCYKSLVSTSLLGRLSVGNVPWLHVLYRFLHHVLTVLFSYFLTCFKLQPCNTFLMYFMPFKFFPCECFALSSQHSPVNRLICSPYFTSLWLFMC